MVWPGMENIQLEDKVQILAERNKLNRDELISGKKYYIWGLIHNRQVIVAYNEIWSLVTKKEAKINQ